MFKHSMLESSLFVDEAAVEETETLLLSFDTDQAAYLRV